jgi:hypothetical protein
VWRSSLRESERLLQQNNCNWLRWLLVAMALTQVAERGFQ